MHIKKWRERAQAKAPSSDPELWCTSLKAGCMEEEILELHEEVKRLQLLQVDTASVRHALQHAHTASRLLIRAHKEQPSTWLGVYDEALVHTDTAIAALEAALLPLN